VDSASERSVTAAAAVGLGSFLPEGTEIKQVRGELAVQSAIPELEELIARGMKNRADYLAERRTFTRYQIEERAARRLRIPEPQVSAGLKRAEFTIGNAPNVSNVTGNGFVVGLNVPIPLFNTGRYEVARYQAEQEQANARMAVLARRIRTEIQGAREVLNIRSAMLAAYQREVESAGASLTRITQLAYQEGEVGILELLDSLRVNRAARLRLIDLQQGVKEALIELERAIGEEFSSKGSRP
jgi:cobalt-zinc-cadmium efflux system outer membrane protein